MLTKVSSDNHYGSNPVSSLDINLTQILQMLARTLLRSIDIAKTASTTFRSRLEDKRLLEKHLKLKVSEGYSVYPRSDTRYWLLTEGHSLYAESCKEQGWNGEACVQHLSNEIREDGHIPTEHKQKIESTTTSFLIHLKFSFQSHASSQRETGSPITNSPRGSASSKASFTSEKLNNNRGRMNKKNSSGDGHDDEPLRPPNRNGPLLNGREPMRKFACPYRKNNPMIYNVLDSQWRFCTGPFSSLARLKYAFYKLSLRHAAD
jgi:hypothetical protein